MPRARFGEKQYFDDEVYWKGYGARTKAEGYRHLSRRMELAIFGCPQGYEGYVSGL